MSTYLLFKPKDKSMLNNKKFYISELNITAFDQPRPEAVSYRRQLMNERTMLEFIEQNFVFDDSKNVIPDKDAVSIRLLHSKYIIYSLSNNGHIFNVHGHIFM